MTASIEELEEVEMAENENAQFQDNPQNQQNINIVQIPPCVGMHGGNNVAKNQQSGVAARTPAANQGIPRMTLAHYDTR